MSNEKEITFGLDIWKGNPSSEVLCKDRLREKAYIRTLAEENLEKLALSVPETNLRIKGNDRITTSEKPILIPFNCYIDFPVTAKEIEKFYEAYLNSRKVYF